MSRRLVVPPGLTCHLCRLPFARQLARRTDQGWRHAGLCGSPLELTGGRWVQVGHVRRWEASDA